MITPSVPWISYTIILSPYILCLDLIPFVLFMMFWVPLLQVDGEPLTIYHIAVTTVYFDTHAKFSRTKSLIYYKEIRICVKLNIKIRSLWNQIILYLSPRG